MFDQDGQNSIDRRVLGGARNRKTNKSTFFGVKKVILLHIKFGPKFVLGKLLLDGFHRRKPLFPDK